MSFINGIRHFKTITSHRMLVMRYCFRAGLYMQGLTHDLSKYSPTEFLVGAKYYKGTYSPNNAERKDLGVSTSWLHHKGRNRHHYEYWIDYPTDPSKGYGLTGTKMPRRFVAEMVFDRVAASRTYNGASYKDSDPLNYFLKSKKLTWYIHPTTKKELEFLLRMWAVKGEDFTIAYIKKVFLIKKKRHRLFFK